MIQGPLSSDLGTDLSKDEFAALMWAAHVGDEASIAALVDEYLRRGLLRFIDYRLNHDVDFDSVQRRRAAHALHCEALDQARRDLLDCGLIFPLHLSRRTSPSRGFLPGEVTVLDSKTGERYVNVHELHWTRLQMIDVALMSEISIDFAVGGGGLERALEPAPVAAPTRAERRAVKTPYFWARERKSETRGFGNTPLGIRAKLKPWER